MERYDKNLRNVGDIILPELLKNNYHIYHQYTIHTKHRDALKDFLEKNGVPTAIHYPLSLHLQPLFKNLGYKQGICPEAEKASKEVLSLPIYPELSPSEQKLVIKMIKSFFQKKKIIL